MNFRNFLRSLFKMTLCTGMTHFMIKLKAKNLSLRPMVDVDILELVGCKIISKKELNLKMIISLFRQRGS